MPAPHHSIFTGRMPFLPPNQQRQSTEGLPPSIVNFSSLTTLRNSLNQLYDIYKILVLLALPICPNMCHFAN